LFYFFILFFIFSSSSLLFFFSCFFSSFFCFYYFAFLCLNLYCLLYSSGHLIIFTSSVFQSISELWQANHSISKIILYFCLLITLISVLYSLLMILVINIHFHSIFYWLFFVEYSIHILYINKSLYFLLFPTSAQILNSLLIS